MNNGLGINFFRYLKEEDEQFWMQVFAKLPFDDVEISQKGSLFGVIRSAKSDNWSELDMEMNTWVDEYFNGIDAVLNLSDFYTEFKKKYSEVDSVWISVSGDKTKRVMKAVGSGSISMLIKRGIKVIDLSKNLDTTRILSGELTKGDSIFFGIGEHDLAKEGVFENISSDKSYGYLNIQVMDVVETKSTDLVEVEIPELAIEETEKREVGVVDIATDRFVGKVGFWDRLRNVTRQKESLTVSTDEFKTRRKKMAVLLGVLFVALLSVSLVLGGAKKRSLEADKTWIEFSEPIEKILNEAVGVAKINAPGAKSMVEEARSRFLSGKTAFDDSDKLVALEKKIDDSWVLVSGEKNAEVVEAVNLELIRAGIGASRISYSDKDLYSVISGENGVVMSVVLGSKEMKVLAGKGAGLGWIDAVISRNKAYVLTKGGVFVAGDESNSLVFDTAVTDPVSLSYFGSSLYVLERGNKEIFKYSVSDSGFGERQRWLKEGQALSFVPVDMDIDVDIWVLGQGGVLERYRRGVKESFALTGLPKEVEVEKVSVEIEGDRIGLLSSKSAMVVICSKSTGVCDKQLKNDKLVEAKDIVFGTGGNLYVLFSGSVGVIN